MNTQLRPKIQKAVSLILLVIMVSATFLPGMTATSARAAGPTVEDIAREVTKDVGVVTTVVDNGTTPPIFVFEERHDSILGQIEIAIMLNRLYTDHNMRHIGLEGLMRDEPPLDLSWAHTEPYFRPDDPISSREDVLVQMAQEGELSAVELIGLIYHDVVIEGIDDADLYAYDPPADAWNTPDIYLYNIALATMSDTNYSIWKALYDAEKYDEAFQYAIETNEFTARMWEKLSDSVNVLPAEEWLPALDEIEQEAKNTEGVKLTAQDAANLDAMRTYFEHVSQRSDAMAQAVLALAEAHPDTPLAVNIGVLHTARLAELLTEAGVSFAVIRPVSLAEGSTAGLLSAEAYQRKVEGLSVAPDGWLASFLDGRKKPRPNGNKKYVQEEASIRQALQYLWDNIMSELISLLEGGEDELKASGLSPNDKKFLEKYKEIVNRVNQYMRQELEKRVKELVVSNPYIRDATIVRHFEILPKEEDTSIVWPQIKLEFASGKQVTIEMKDTAYDAYIMRDPDIRAALRAKRFELKQVTLPHRLDRARKEVEEQKEPTSEDGTRPQNICSTLRVTPVTKGGG